MNFGKSKYTNNSKFKYIHTHITFFHKNWAFMNKTLVFGMNFGNLWFGQTIFVLSNIL